MIRYRVKLTPDDNDTFLVTSPDFPEVITFGETREEALHYAVGADRMRVLDTNPIAAGERSRLAHDSSVPA